MARRRRRAKKPAIPRAKKLEHASVVASNDVDATTVLASSYVLQTIRHMLVGHEMLHFLLSCQRLAAFTFAFLRYWFCRTVGGIVPSCNFVSLHVGSWWTFDPRSCYPSLQELDDRCDRERSLYCPPPMESEHSHGKTVASSFPYEIHFPRLRKLSLCLSKFGNTFVLPTTLTALHLTRMNVNAVEDHFLNLQKALLPSSLLDLRLTGRFNIASFLLPPQLEKFKVKFLASPYTSAFGIALPFPQQLRVLKMDGHGINTANLPPTLEKLHLYHATSLGDTPCVSRLTNLRVLKIPDVVIREPLPQSLRILECSGFFGPPATLHCITSLRWWRTGGGHDISPHLSSLTELHLSSTIKFDHTFQIPPTVVKLSLPGLEYLGAKRCASSFLELQHLHLRSLDRADPSLLLQLAPNLMKISFSLFEMSKDNTVDVLGFCRYHGLDVFLIELLIIARVPRSAFISSLCIERSVEKVWDRLTYVCGICQHATFLSPNDDLVLAMAPDNSLACSSCTVHRARK